MDGWMGGLVDGLAGSLINQILTLMAISVGDFDNPPLLAASLLFQTTQIGVLPTVRTANWFSEK